MFAIAEFGSTARNTSDGFSDRDLLIVCEKNAQSKLYDSYTDKGYSVSVFTPDQLIHMQNQGSLFIQHLKMESKILIDSNGKLSQFLNTCKLTPPSSSEIQRCISSINFIAEWDVNTDLSAWKADFLYCLSRDVLIKILATKGILAFGFEAIQHESCTHLDIKKSEFIHLFILRKAKSAYRSDSKIPIETINAIDDWLDILSRLLFIENKKKYNYALDLHIPHLLKRKFNSPYEKLRSLEAIYLVARANGLYHPQHELIIKHIVCPNLYGSSQARKEHVIDQYLDEVAWMLTNNPIQPIRLPLRSTSLQSAL